VIRLIDIALTWHAARRARYGPPMSDIDLPFWLVIFLPYLTTPGWALASFLVAFGFAFWAGRRRKRRWLFALVAASIASFSVPIAGLVLLDAGAPAIACLVVGLAIAAVVLYLRSGSPGER